jgi:hypothetical protein
VTSSTSTSVVWYFGTTVATAVKPRGYPFAAFDLGVAGDDARDVASTRTKASAERSAPSDRRTIDRVQTGVRLEKRLLQVLKALASSHGLTLGDLLEGIVLHAFDGACPFGPESMRKIDQLKKVYGLDLAAGDSHLLVERGARARPSRR